MEVGHLFNGKHKVNWHEHPLCKGKPNAWALCVHMPNPKQKRDIRKGAIVIKEDENKKPKEKFDYDKFSELLMCAYVIDWRNITLNGEPLECTDKNKIEMNDRVQEYNDFWNDLYNRESLLKSKILEDDRKNLLSGQDSILITP